MENPFIKKTDILKKHIFFYITKKIVDKYYNQKSNIINIILDTFIDKNIYSLKNKYKFIDVTLKNKFNSIETKIEFLNSIIKIQKVYLGLIKLINIYKYKKSATQIDTDLCLNLIDTTKKTCMCIYQNKKKYWFLIRDLINIINNALSNSPGFFSEPLISKNPYNNIPFSKSILYNIYFNIKYSGLKIPELIHKFFITNFNLTTFTQDYEYLIREHAIDNYIRNASDISLYPSVKLMLTNFNKIVSKKNNIIIDTEFPKERLVQIMKPCLLLFFRSIYSLVKIISSNSSFKLKRKLLLLIKNNRCFGRKIITVERYYKKLNSTKQSIRLKFFFNDKHINLNVLNNNCDSFLQSHTINNEDEYEDDNNVIIEDNFSIINNSVYITYNNNYAEEEEEENEILEEDEDEEEEDDDSIS
jgi:hypothetical protein